MAIEAQPAAVASAVARSAPRLRSKTVATWLALVGGSLGLHRFYLHGLADRWGWAHSGPALIGAYGAWRLREYGVEDRLGAWLVPFLGAVLAASMLAAILIGLTPDDRWNARHGGGTRRSNGWLAVVGVALALALGAGITMATLAFAAQRYFELRGA